MNAYDAHYFDMDPLTSAGAEGALRITVGAIAYDEETR